jgi:hypothetical protein
VVLANQPTYPQSRTYVLKLRCDAVPESGHVSGVIENLTTGKRLRFVNGQELIAILEGESRDSANSNPPTADTP